MFKRRLLCLLAVILGLTLLPATTFARDHDRDWGHNHWTYNRGYNRKYGNGYYRNGYYGYRNGYYGNGNYGCVDRDGDGDCDHIRHHHHHYYYQNGWYGNPHVYSNPNVWGNYPYAGGWRNGNGAWRNGRWGSGNIPPGWQRGRKNGWGNSNLPPGLAKKSGWW